MQFRGDGNSENSGVNDNGSVSVSGFVFSRTDTDEYRYVLGNGNIWIDSSCAAELGGASQSGTWSDLNAIAPNFDAISNPCAGGENNGNEGSESTTNMNNNGGTNLPSDGFVFSRTDADEYRYVMGTGNVWIDAACASELGGVSRTGTWSDLNAIAPNFDAISNPCTTVISSNPGPTGEPSPDPSQSGSAYGDVWLDSPYDHSGVEVTNQVSVPIRYRRVFDRERELHGYNPRYMPGRTYFDKFNLPWIYTHTNNQLNNSDPSNPIHVDAITDQPTGKALHSVTYSDRLYANRYSNWNECPNCDSLILRLTPEGNWVYFSLDDMARQFGFGSRNPGPSLRTDVRELEQIYFRSNGDVFIPVSRGLIIFDSSENTWKGIGRSDLGPRYLMTGNGENPPVFVRSRENDNVIRVLEVLENGSTFSFKYIEKELEGNLSLDSGISSAVVFGRHLHIAMMSQNENTYGRPESNTAQVYVRLNLDSEHATQHFMGWSGNNRYGPPDNHNKPAIVLDNDGYIHFISGAHSHYIWHRRSLSPVSDGIWQSEWNDQTDIDNLFTPGPQQSVGDYHDSDVLEEGVDYIGGRNPYTYSQVVLTEDNKIHVVLRTSYYQADGTPSSLVYFRGEPTGNGDYVWSDRRYLVQPRWYIYSGYLHRLHADRQSNLYVTYTYEIQGLDLGQWYSDATGGFWDSESDCAAQSSPEDCVHVVNEHNRRWPTEPLSFGHWAGQNFPHDPVLLGSHDGGSTWQLTTTGQLQSAEQSPNDENVVRR